MKGWNALHSFYFGQVIVFQRWFNLLKEAVGNARLYSA